MTNALSPEVIVGRCCLHLFQIVSDEVSPQKHPTECLGAEYSLVGTNSSELDNDLVLGGFYVSSAEYAWVEWICRFESFKLEWDVDVTLEEWRNGKLPEADKALVPTPERHIMQAAQPSSESSDRLALLARIKTPVPVFGERENRVLIALAEFPNHFPADQSLLDRFSKRMSHSCCTF